MEPASVPGGEVNAYSFEVQFQGHSEILYKSGVFLLIGP